MLKGYVILKMFFSRCLLKIFCAKTVTETWRYDSDLNFRHPLCYDSTSIKIFTPRSIPRLHIPTNTPHGFYVETTWKRPFPRRFNVESTECVCRVEPSKSPNTRILIYSGLFLGNSVVSRFIIYDRLLAYCF